MVEVFRTAIIDEKQAMEVKMELAKLGYQKIAFDLEDCDKIMRIEAGDIRASEVIFRLNMMRISCEVLEDDMPVPVHKMVNSILRELSKHE